jgi:predicted lipoprotein
MKKILFIALIAIVGYNSVYFEKLSTRNKKSLETTDFQSVAQELYTDISKIDAPAIATLQQLAQTNKDSLFHGFGNRLGIGNSAYFMAKIEGTVVALNEQEIQIRGTDSKVYTLGLDFIFGNAIRDASKLVKLTDYKKTAEFNALSEALNAIIREKEIPKSVANLKTGDNIVAKVAFKLGKEESDFSKFSYLPVSIISSN